MTGKFRLPSGGRIDRSRPLHFSFDGKSYVGAFGDTLASALLANGVHLVGRSFKYHRPRGILGAGPDEPNALVGIGGGEDRYTPNVRATEVELYDGLVAESQNRWPSLAFDLGAVNDLLAPLLPAGFYYKTFMWPAGAWRRIYEPRIRAMAGLGRAPKRPDPDRYTQCYAHCDVLIVGAGPSGLAAALAAADAGARVIICDEQSELGGTLLAPTDATIDSASVTAWLAKTTSALSLRKRVAIYPRTTAFGYFPHNMVGLVERVTSHLSAPDPRYPRERLHLVRAKQVIFATGALERPLPFPDNDRPGIMLADAARTYVTRYGVKPGTRAVVVTNNDTAYRSAIDLVAAGIEVAAIVDQRAPVDAAFPARARALGIPIHTAATIAGTSGRRRVSRVWLADLEGHRHGPEIGCDLVLMSGGMTPSVHLFYQTRDRLEWNEKRRTFLPGPASGPYSCAGACGGASGLQAALESGAARGLAAAKAAGYPGNGTRRFAVRATEPSSAEIPDVPAAAAVWPRAFIDFQNDVKTSDLVLAIREGFRSIEHIKRYTTAGMATDQGKTSNMNALGVVSRALNVPIPEVGLTTFRMPYTPVTFGSLAGQSRGELFDPVRRTPIDAWAQEHGAVFEDVGQWKRARYFPLSGEDMEAAVSRECRAVRTAVGIFDGSTLGKIEVIGPHAVEFLNRMYINDWTNLEPGKLRYGVILREDGFILDDGVVGRLAPDRFFATTTTGGAARVLHMMEDYLQTEWPNLDVWLTSVTEQWAVIAVQGPQARRILEPLVDIDISRDAMPHMSVREGRIAGVPMRLFRVSFTGELGYEIYVPADFGRAVWDAVMQSGAPHGITPYGTEAMHVLRAEKGYIIIGQETDGTVIPQDVGLGWAIGKSKRDFVGKRSLARPAMAAADRKQLVGLLTLDRVTVLEEGAQIVSDPNVPVPMTMIGHVTSSYWSSTLGRPIALAMLKGGRKRIGERLVVPMPDKNVPVEVVKPVFVDVEGARLDG